MYKYATDEFVAELRSLVPEVKDDRPDPTPAEVAAAKAELFAGNALFSAGGTGHYPDTDRTRREVLAKDQFPIAAIVCCSDSRVPPEIVHWQGLGRIFVIREAGQVLDHHGRGSVHYAIEKLKIPLLVVLGHAKCGAVSAAIDLVATQDCPPKTPLGALVGAIVPAVEAVWTASEPAEFVIEKCVREHVRRTAELLRHDAIVAAQVSKGALEVITGYHLASGSVLYA